MEEHYPNKTSTYLQKGPSFITWLTYIRHCTDSCHIIDGKFKSNNYELMFSEGFFTPPI